MTLVVNVRNHSITDDQVEKVYANYDDLLSNLYSTIDEKKFEHLQQQCLQFNIILTNRESYSQNQKLVDGLKNIVEQPPNPQYLKFMIINEFDLCVLALNVDERSRALHQSQDADNCQIDISVIIKEFATTEASRNNQFECSVMLNNKLMDSEFYKVILGKNQKQLETQVIDTLPISYRNLLSLVEQLKKCFPRVQIRMSIFDIKSSLQQNVSKDEKTEKVLTGYEATQFEVVQKYFQSFQMKEAQLDVRTI